MYSWHLPIKQVANVMWFFKQSIPKGMFIMIKSALTKRVSVASAMALFLVSLAAAAAAEEETTVVETSTPVTIETASGLNGSGSGGGGGGGGGYGGGGKPCKYGESPSSKNHCYVDCLSHNDNTCENVSQS